MHLEKHPGFAEGHYNTHCIATVHLNIGERDNVRKVVFVFWHICVFVHLCICIAHCITTVHLSVGERDNAREVVDKCWTVLG